MDESIRSGCQREIDARTRTTAKANHLFQLLHSIIFGETGCEYNVNDIFFNLLVDIHLANNFAGLNNILRRENRKHWLLLAHDILADNLLLFFFLGVADNNLEHESVGLRFGKRVGSFLLDGVLGCQYEEGGCEFMCLVTYRHLALLHGFEQCGLHLGGSTVDLIRKYEIREDRAFLYAEFLALLAKDLRTDNIGREQVGGKLNTAEISFDKVTQRFDS